MVYICTFTLAFCSIVYELLLGQSLSAFLGNTVLRYSVTIGLYMLSMGIGAFLAENRVVRHPVVSLQIIEVFLTIIGGGAVIGLFVINGIIPSGTLFSILAHSFIVAIGILTGMEIPLLIEVQNIDKPESEGSVLGIDYLGAFAGTVVFAFFFYPHAGLLTTALFVALLNALVGIALVTQRRKVAPHRRSAHRALLALQVCLLIALTAGFYHLAEIREYYLQGYLGQV